MRKQEIVIYVSEGMAEILGHPAAMISVGWAAEWMVPKRGEHTIIKDGDVLEPRCPGSRVMEVLWSGDQLKVYFFDFGNRIKLRPRAIPPVGNIRCHPTAYRPSARPAIQKIRRGQDLTNVIRMRDYVRKAAPAPRLESLMAAGGH